VNKDEKHRHLNREIKKWGGYNKILEEWQHTAVIKYATDQALYGKKGAVIQIVFNCIIWLRAGVKKGPHIWRWFRYWLKPTLEPHKI